MSQAAFAFDLPTPQPARRAHAARARPAAPAAAAPDPIAFAIGWDHARHGVPLAAHPRDDHEALHLGWRAGRAAFAARTRAATPAVHDWLGLRLQAWRAGVPFEELQVTPRLLARLAPERCPVTGVALTRRTGACSDATVVRLNAAAAYASGNLAVMSRRAADALEALRAGLPPEAAVQAALDRAEPAAAAPPSVVADGALDAPGWQRLAVLMSFTTWLPEPLALALPLSVLPPNRVRVLQPVQALKVVLTMVFCQPRYARALCELAVRVPDGAARRGFHVFMHTLLARRLASGAVLGPQQARLAMTQAWSHPLVRQRWQVLARHLDAATIEPLLRRAVQPRGGWMRGQWLSQEMATQGWALDAAVDAPQAAASPDAARPALH